MKLAIFMPNWIGDVVMATPALRAIRNTYPSAEIVGIMRPYVADVLEGTRFVDRSMYYDPRGKNSSHRGFAFIRALRAERFDTSLLLPNSLRTGLLAWMSGAKRRIGFSRDLRGMWLTDRIVPRSKSTPHPVLDEYLRLAESFGCDTSQRKTELAVQPIDQAKLEEFWKGRHKDHSVDGNDAASAQPPKFICFNTGGAFGAAKNWPREYFAALAHRIACELGIPVLIVCGPAERDDARWIAAEANHPTVVSLADAPLSIGLTKAAVEAAQLLVTTDSGPRHFAAPFRTPVITLFGPTHIAWSETDYDLGEHLQLKLDCGPCQQRECPLKHHRCMRDLTVDQVFNAVKRQLSKTLETIKAA